MPTTIEFDELRASIADCSNLDELESCFSVIIKKLGYHAFDAFSFSKISDWVPSSPQNFVICDYVGHGLIEKYLTERMVMTDHTLTNYGETTAPFDLIAHLKDRPKNATLLWQIATVKFFGIKHAWAIPHSTIKATRGVTVYLKGKTPAQTEHFLATKDEVHLISSSLFARIDSLHRIESEDGEDGNPSQKQSFNLTGRESDCLHWATQGKTNWEIAKILDISENTVRYHFKNIYRKLGCNSRSQAVRIGINAKLVME
ncbi:helix-turn-helix transcriptional regulator [Erythrobacter sp.]|uniref:helix-turn-helix transcriptional regulator n=1 Tax=Sphingomonadales TaxID=204457 RepID=UPI003265274C